MGRALQDMHRDNAELRAERSSLAAEKARLLSGISALRNEVRGTQVEQEMQHRLHELSLAHTQAGTDATSSPEVADNHALFEQIALAAANAQRHFDEFQRAGARSA